MLSHRKHPNQYTPELNDEHFAKLDHFEVKNVGGTDSLPIIHLQWGSCSVVVARNTIHAGGRLLWANRAGRAFLGIDDADQPTDKS